MLQPATLKFLRDLKKNNNKPWFDAHRPQYETAKKDFELFIQEVISKHGKKDSDIKDILAKNCLFRINRDVRFSKDKSPYKTNMGAYISKGGKKSPFGGYYFHCEPGQSFIGGGIWQPEPDKIKKIRQEIDYNWDEFKKLIGSKKFKSIYKDLYTGEDMSLSKVPQGFEKDNPAAKYLKLKSWIAMRNVKDTDLTSKGLLKLTLDTFDTLHPLLKFLNRAVED
jgi:uncharacterized protein (TIGR02453 family)